MFGVFADSGPHISIASEVLFHLGPLPITNSMMLGILGYTILLSVFFSTVFLLKKGSRSLFMHAVIWIFQSLYSSIEEVTGDKKRARQIAPLAITIFFALLINNWLGLLPIVGPVTYNGQPLFRGLAADLNLTLALAIISMISVQIWAVKSHGFFRNIGRYVRNPLKDPLGAFEGFLEFISEFSRLIALCMRLFGNVLGGEILLIVIAFVTKFGAPLVLPVFMSLELFVGAVQAYVFFMLTVVFITVGSVSHDHNDAHATEPEHHSIETKPTVSSTGIDSR